MALVWSKKLAAAIVVPCWDDSAWVSRFWVSLFCILGSPVCVWACVGMSVFVYKCVVKSVHLHWHSLLVLGYLSNKELCFFFPWEIHFQA